MTNEEKTETAEPTVKLTKYNLAHHQTELDMAELDRCANLTDSNNVHLSEVRERLLDDLVVENLQDQILAMVEVSQSLDLLKKHVYYGKLTTFSGELSRSSSVYDKYRVRLADEKVIRLLHCAIGLATEAGEALEILSDHIYHDQPLDEEHFNEELGDSTWYIRIGLFALGRNLLNCILSNVRKLIFKRYKGQVFTQQEAVNRDLEGERKALEGSTNA